MSYRPVTASPFNRRRASRRPLLPARLLVDLPNWVGDLVMAMPAVARLVAANADGVTVLNARPSARRLLEVLFPRAQVLASCRRASPFAMAWRFRRDGVRFEVGITLRNAERAKILLRLVSRHSMGSACGCGRVLLSEPLPVDRSRHQVFDSDAILASLTLPGADPGWRPAIAPHLLDEGRARLREAGLWNRTLVGLAPSAAWGESKRWPCERFGHLARKLLGDGLQPVLLIGPGEEELAEQVRTAAGTVLPVLGADVDLAGLAGVMTSVAVVVGNDSGPIHLAGLSGAATVALFGPTDSRRTAPLGGGLVVSDSLPCSPCFARVCPLDHNRCLRELDVDTVLAGVQELMEERTALAARTEAG